MKTVEKTCEECNCNVIKDRDSLIEDKKMDTILLMHLFSLFELKIPLCDEMRTRLKERIDYI